MSSLTRASAGGGWRRFLERLGLYLLVGPPVAAATFLLHAALFGSLLYIPPWHGNLATHLLKMWAFLSALLYLIALPVAGIYAAMVSGVLAHWERVGFVHVAFCALPVAAILYLPMLILMAPSDPTEEAEGLYWFALHAAYLPVFAAGLACKFAIPSLHKRPAS